MKKRASKIRNIADSILDRWKAVIAILLTIWFVFSSYTVIVHFTQVSVHTSCVDITPHKERR